VAISVADDLAHGVVEGEAEDLDKEVNGVAGLVTLRPAPVAVFDDEAGIGRDLKVSCLLLDELECSFLEQRQQGSHSGGADLLTSPAGSNGVRAPRILD